MPHQLRRIITINIRNPKDGMPSGRIAELDPRGGVLAVGINGVGKTTFLRLLPLFYGATPTQILKGTGRTALVSHTLPDQSSAVCYEYERQTQNDVRCVVMHARPGEEAPQFHIVSGPYRESYFYDENKQYVTRDEFKARVEAMGVEVSRKLSLHQYRSVILNERLPTKEGVELRRMAAVHSLGPGALYNLDQIAAAMANEKLSFRDLKNIVVERVSDASTAANKTTNVKELKQNRESVVRWLEARAQVIDSTNDRVRRMLQQLEHDGYLVETNPVNKGYQVTGKVNYLYQLLAFIGEHTPHLSDDGFVDQIDPQVRFDTPDASSTQTAP